MSSSQFKSQSYLDNLYEELRYRLKRAVGRNKAEGILLSGGLDSSILALVAKPKIAFTAALKDSDASDLLYSEKLARFLRIEHRKVEFSAAEALEAIPQVISMLKTFDLALPNDLSIYFALKLAKKSGIDSVITGDGGDELFAGYSYMMELPPQSLGSYIRSLSQSYHFSVNELGKALGIEIEQPFLDKDFVSFALAIAPQLKVKEGIGKYILRKSFEGLMSEEIIWRRKEPIEQGSGSDRLHKVIADMVSDEEFQSAKERTGIAFINKEHFFYYHIYNKVVGEIPKAKEGEKKCSCCGAAIDKLHCRVCGFSLPSSGSNIGMEKSGHHFDTVYNPGAGATDKLTGKSIDPTLPHC
jgi:asparagine synthase (glutamine-hydrolysing)